METSLPPSLVSVSPKGLKNPPDTPLPRKSLPDCFSLPDLHCPSVSSRGLSACCSSPDHWVLSQELSHPPAPISPLSGLLWGPCPCRCIPVLSAPLLSVYPDLREIALLCMWNDSPLILATLCSSHLLMSSSSGFSLFPRADSGFSLRTQAQNQA